MMKHLIGVPLVLVIAGGCTRPVEKPISEQTQPQPIEQTQTPAVSPAPVIAIRAYPDVCVAPPPPDLDCKDIEHRNFRVLPFDPHRFDGKDQDGVGCESK